MKKVMCVLLVCLLAGLSLAQTEEPPRDKDLGVLFSFHGLSNLGVSPWLNIEGAMGIGAKMFQDQKAFRVGLIFGTNSSKDESSVDNYVGEESSASGFGVSADYLIHLNDQKITPYIGAGVGFFTGKETTEEAHMEGSGYSEVEEKLSAFYVRAIFGLEVFLKKNISLSGEYQLPFSSTTATLTSENKSSNGSLPTSVSNTSESRNKSSSFGIGTAAYLTLTIYFNEALF